MEKLFSEVSDMITKNKNAHIPDMLLDPLNCQMYDHVRPMKWVDPQAQDGETYDMLVIGAGAGGLITSLFSGAYGAKTCLIERGNFGGDCLVTGCVPSKAFIKSASVAHQLRTCEEYGIKIKGEIEVDFPAVMERMKKIRTRISANDAAKRFTERYGLDVFLGHAEFKGKHEV